MNSLPRALYDIFGWKRKNVGGGYETETNKEITKSDRMPCITYDLLVRVQPWEFGSSPM